MKTKIEPIKSTVLSGDIFKYFIASLLLVLGVFVWFLFSRAVDFLMLGSWAPQLRGLVVMLVFVAAASVLMTTAKGREFRGFLFESRFELRKVVWPTRQEAIRMTWVVIVMITILSLLLGGFDFVIQKLTQWFLSR
ncbi:preprotein translocase subunit SecE [Xylella fastidiosa]|uniref:Protein translocase subunit SecE n=1 Tax=Xylella fastidiosa subsp. multiplex TaxID=644357 RepID=A0A9Q4MKA5_XYLFS|nr:preprotein translocase subunit SecE [Xylella fastidiosa]ERI59340.1 preprotein translocase subunit SecE [Xylella fastidiosa subsp. multiplex Griffin-1]ACA13055.1 preprotein translocase SecE subunit [Xylella fastidiosa M12]KAJ4853742.1 preprotein translocase subunit SecE [Xylella fastidiosa subsp. multiplex]KFA40930.1 preprotein translocase subunit SecE [Xylella fastidiosa]MBE0267913.1 preprotein translocase subunit SecE [Xylella fastidiosa subsp. multiplex]